MSGKLTKEAGMTGEQPLAYRLRRHAPDARSAGIGTRAIWAGLMVDAADEIDRLQAELAKEKHDYAVLYPEYLRQVERAEANEALLAEAVEVVKRAATALQPFARGHERWLEDEYCDGHSMPAVFFAAALAVHIAARSFLEKMWEGEVLNPVAPLRCASPSDGPEVVTLEPVAGSSAGEEH